jgi:hypothetical protein
MIPYILNVAILVAGCLAFYKVFLQRETFFRLNRWVLVACLLLAFVLPLARVPAALSLRKPRVETAAPPSAPPIVRDAVNDLTGAAAGPIVETPVAPEGTQPRISTVKVEAGAKFDMGRVLQWVAWLYWFGVAAFALNFLLQMGLLLYRAYANPVIRDGRYRIVELSGDVAPCSFGNNIFINPEKYDWDTYQQVLEHEKVHCRGRHTWDIVLAELVLIFQWFNPFAWIYRKTLEHNLEFLTDEELLQRRALDPSSYQMSLLRVSAPHLPLGLTTNYNQSLLKKRILMMQAKKSNWHTTWKYLFLLPLMAVMMCLLNEPAAQAQSAPATKKERKHNIETEGYWFATIKGDRVQFNFQNTDDPNSRNMNGSSFNLSELPNLPRNGQGSFSLKRDAGTMDFTGRFDGDQGMGRYKFTADPAFADYLKGQGIEPGTDEDRMVLFFVNASKAYVADLKAEGYTSFTRNDLIPLAALKVDRAYISSLKSAGLNNVSIHDLIPLRSLGVDKAYIEDIRKVYPNVGASRLISLKAQGIDSKYINDVRSSGAGRSTRDTGYRSRPDDGSDGNWKGKSKDKQKDKPKDKDRDRERERDEERERSEGGNSADLNEIISMKALGVDDAYIRSIREAGFPDIPMKRIIGFKALGVTPAYINDLRSLNLGELRATDVEGAKANHVTAEYVKSFEGVGFRNLRMNQYISMKAVGVTPALVQEYKDLGFTDIRPNDVIGAKSVGATPAFIRDMKAKGYEFKTLNKAIGQKASVD